jgi:hypothetical protein
MCQNEMTLSLFILFQVSSFHKCGSLLLLLNIIYGASAMVYMGLLILLGISSLLEKLSLSLVDVIFFSMLPVDVYFSHITP